MNRVLMRMASLHCWGGDVMMNWNDDEMVVAIVVVDVIPIGMMIQLLHLKQCQIDDESHENATMMILLLLLPQLLLMMKKQSNATDESLDDDAMMNDASDDDDEDDEMILHLHLLLQIAKIAIILLHVDDHEHESNPYLTILLDNDAPIPMLQQSFLLASEKIVLLDETKKKATEIDAPYEKKMKLMDDVDNSSEGVMKMTVRPHEMIPHNDAFSPGLLTHYLSFIFQRLLGKHLKMRIAWVIQMVAFF